jgi:hypothetical protein
MESQSPNEITKGSISAGDQAEPNASSLRGFPDFC